MLWLQWSCIMVTIIVHYDYDGRALRLGQLCIIKVMMVVHYSYNGHALWFRWSCIMVTIIVHYGYDGRALWLQWLCITVKMVVHYGSFIHFIHSGHFYSALQVLYYSEALPTTARILHRSFTPKRTGNCR